MKRNAKNLRKYKKVCAEIWGERDHVCEDCGNPLRTARWHNFHHLNGRRSEKELLDKSGILLCCFTCHAKREGKTVHGAKWLDY